MVRKKAILIFLAVFLLLGFGAPAYAQEAGPLVLNDSQTRYSLDAVLEYYADAGGALTISDVSQAAFSGQFVRNSGQPSALGNAQKAIWIRLVVRNESAYTRDWRLAFSDARLGLIDLYAPAAEGSIWMNQRAGFLLPSTARQNSHHQYVFELDIAPGSQQSLYLRLTSPTSSRFSLSLWSGSYFEQSSLHDLLVLGLFYGLMAAMMLSNLLAFLFTRQWIHFMQLLVIAFYTLSIAFSDGIGYLYFFPNLAHPYTRNVVGLISTLAMAIFAIYFLRLKKYTPRLFLGIVGLTALLTVLYLVSFFISGVSGLLNAITTLLTVTYLLCAFYLWRRGVRPALFFMLGMAGPVFASILRGLTELGLLQYSRFADQVFYIAGLWLTLFLFLSVTERLHQDRLRVVRVENEARATSERFRLLYEHSPMGIAMLDPHWKIERANPAFSELLGYTGEGLNQSSYLELVYHQDRQQAAALHEELASGKISFYEKEARFMCKDGGLVWCVCSVYSLRSEAGALQYIFVIVNDITRRKEYEQELKQYGENLEELVAARTSDLELNQQRLSNLNQSIGSVSAAGLNIERLYHAIWKETLRLVKADAFSISLVDLEAGQVEDVFLIDEHGQQPRERYALPDSFVSEMINTRAGFVVTDFTRLPDDQWKGFWFGSHANVRSGMAIALIGSQAAIGMLTVQSYRPAAYSAGDLSILEAFAAHVSIALENLHLHQHAQQAVILEERQRLARELHDSVTQMLYSIALLSNGWSLQASQNRLENPSNSFNQLEGLSLQALKEMRLLIHQLRSPLLDELGLVKALQRRLETVEQSANVITDLSVQGELPKFHPAVEADIYAIVQEALNNALRHAHASHTTIEIVASEGHVCFSVHDDGVGFDPAKTTSGMGSRTIRERAKAIHAQLDVQSQLGQGTTVTLSIAI